MLLFTGIKLVARVLACARAIARIKWRRLYMLYFSKKLKLCTKLVPIQYMKVFTSKFICNNLYLLFVVIFIIYLQSSTKVVSTTGTSHRMTSSSAKSIAGVTFMGKCMVGMSDILLSFNTF